MNRLNSANHTFFGASI